MRSHNLLYRVESSKSKHFENEIDTIHFLINEHESLLLGTESSKSKHVDNKTHALPSNTLCTT